MPALTQTVAEARRSALKALMEAVELEALAFLTPAYICFATNFLPGWTEPWERPMAVVLPRRGEPFALFHELSENSWADAAAAGTLWPTDVTFYGEHPGAAQRMALTPQWSQTLADLLRSNGVDSGRIGVDLMSAVITETARALPGLAIVDVEEALRALRWVKHDEELAVMRNAAALSDWGQERYREHLRPGQLVQELDCLVQAEVAAEASRRFDGEYLELIVFTLAGAESAAPDGGAGRIGKRLTAGEPVVNIVCVRLNGLWIENERTWFCGSPDEAHRRAFDAAREAQLAAVSQLRTDRPVCAADEAARAVLDQSGFGGYVRHRAGHGLGIELHEHPHDMAFDARPLRKNEVYSAEPGIYIPGRGGYRLDDTVVVGDVPEVLTSTPTDLSWLSVG